MWSNSDKLRMMRLQSEKMHLCFILQDLLVLHKATRCCEPPSGMETGLHCFPSMCPPKLELSECWFTSLGKKHCLGNAALLIAQDGENSKMTFRIRAGNILSSDLNKAMTVPLIFLGWYSSEEWNGAACTARKSQWWVRGQGSCYRASPPELSCGLGSQQQCSVT